MSKRATSVKAKRTDSEAVKESVKIAREIRRGASQMSREDEDAFLKRRNADDLWRQRRRKNHLALTLMS